MRPFPLMAPSGWFAVFSGTMNALRLPTFLLGRLRFLHRSILPDIRLFVSLCRMRMFIPQSPDSLGVTPKVVLDPFDLVEKRWFSQLLGESLHVRPVLGPRSNLDSLP